MQYEIVIKDNKEYISMSVKKYIGAIDQGTTSTRFILFDHAGQIKASHLIEHRQYYPQAGWVEHDALEIWENTQKVIRETLRKAEAGADDIAAIGNHQPTGNNGSLG